MISDPQIPSGIIARRCYVSGRVQGVFYRGATQQQAVNLGLSGYARNLPDGRVEVLAVGKSGAVQSLIGWLAQGPPAARVTGVEVAEISLQELGDIPPAFATK